MSEISELMDVGDSLTTLKSPLSTGDEFFDAVDDVGAVVKEDDDLFKKIENAISDENPPPAKRPRTDETVDNGDKAESDFGDTISSISGKNDEGDDLKILESDKFEDELLKDSDDEQGEVMEAVEKELEDLLELELGDKKPEESAEKNEVSAADDDKIDEDLENKLLEDDEVVPESKSAEVDLKTSENEPKAVTELESAVPEEPATETNELEKEEPLKENDENRTKSPVPDEVEESPEKVEGGTISKETPKEPESPPEQEVPKNDATKSAEDDDDLLEACDSPEKVLQPETEENQQDDASVVSSTPDETPEESSDEKAQTESNQETKTDEQPTTTEGDEDKMEVDDDKEEVGEDKVEVDDDKVGVDEDKVEVEDKIEVDEEETAKKDDETTPEPMEATDNVEKIAETESIEKSTEENAETLEVIEEPKEVVPVKLQFMRKFAKTVGKISRPELEELLVQKITESLMFCSENTELRARLEKQEKLCEAFKKRLDNVVKQYNDLEMIHKRVMKDLKDRPEAPITPVKITRAVGLQVYQPVSRTKAAAPVPASPMFNLQSNKRPTEDTQVNGKSPENSQKKKKRITPLRPPLSATERASLEAMEAREEQKLRTNVGKSITSAPNVTLSPVANGGPKKAMPNSLTSSQSIDLTDDPDEESSSSGAKSGSQTPQPPALVAIQANNQQRSAYSVKPPIIVPANSSANRLVQFRTGQVDVNRVAPTPRGHPAPLPMAPAQILKPGMKKIPPKPAIKITNVANGIIVSWTVETLTLEHAEIVKYQIYAYEETNSSPSTENWRHVGDVKALLLPMAVTLTQFQEGQKYWFAVRAVDAYKRLSQFSAPRTWTE